jgi:UDP-3-O-[3-hydroxymyristoyl] glucosamine N-acyltransferase
MADPRFYDNRGPVPLEALCAKIGVARPIGADGRTVIYDIAGLTQAGPQHLSFFDGGRAKHDFAATKAGWCLVRQEAPPAEAPSNTVLLSCASVPHAFAAAAKLFYAEDSLGISAQDQSIHPSAQLAKGVVLAPGVIIGPNVAVGENTRLGANAIIGRGVTIGRNSEIGSHVWIGYAHLGDDVLIMPGVRIGGPGFGFASAPDGHTRMPQLGRVIIQDRVEIGGNSAVDRGALGDTVIGEGTKIDNLVHIAHNCRIGRNCIIAGQVGMAGSVTLGDFVVIGGKAGIGDHATVGSGARIAAMSGVANSLPGGQDYMGYLARPVREWRKEQATLARLAKSRRRITSDE